ncbi:MAG: hypothetical protein R3D60_02895 [Paracoccaceae bacterium]
MSRPQTWREDPDDYGYQSHHAVDDRFDLMPDPDAPAPPLAPVYHPVAAAPVAQARPSRAFDWDADQGEVQVHKAIPDEIVFPKRRHGLSLRSLLVYWIAPGALVAGLAAAGVMIATKGAENTADGGVMPGFLAVLLDGGIGPMPDDMLVYAEPQYRNFVAGIGQIGDSDLVALAERTALDLRPFEDPMTPFMLDSLYLVQREILRRGLQVPVAAADVQSTRESFRAATRSL